MEYSIEKNLFENDNLFIKEFYKTLHEEREDFNDHPPKVYNPAFFKLEYIINFFLMKGILNKAVICSTCGKLYKMVKEYQSMDNYISECRDSNPSHDVKINIRKNSILENMHINMQ